ncbi:MAG TPA: DUF3515 family protein [Mycobacteriales bacterium]|nr:DUF3515 family protein [Mycobacteriales bacterium]
MVPGSIFVQVALVGVLLAGCSDEPVPPPPTGPVDVPVPTASAPLILTSCAQLLQRLPAEIADGVGRRSVRDASRTAAWGEPPVTLRCGVPLPERESEAIEVGPIGRRVAWTVRDIGDGYAFTTRDRAVNVTLDVPGSYGNPADLLRRLAEAVTATLPTPEAAPGA